jgi:hypothetical protein
MSSCDAVPAVDWWRRTGFCGIARCAQNIHAAGLALAKSGDADASWVKAGVRNLDNAAEVVRRISCVCLAGDIAGKCTGDGV